METPKTKNERCEQAEARAVGQVGMREPKKRQGSALKETSSRTRKRDRDAVGLSAEQTSEGEVNFTLEKDLLALVHLETETTLFCGGPVCSLTHMCISIYI